jgi:hypothetical protein
MARSTTSPVAIPGTLSSPVPGRPVALNLILSLRPGQWTKNLQVSAWTVVVAAIVHRPI